ncbi:hypothetical protein Acr_21g0007330 [Actinidia rufa]|uniref:Uncharacterized protein n=1 Tax=Actinidia rufa TaxID=165716 RepID=A0A7J0GHB0_9ERIC|nr:hypothetical protein Acr_21g0007330 [Actinidia rufa]
MLSNQTRYGTTTHKNGPLTCNLSLFRSTADERLMLSKQTRDVTNNSQEWAVNLLSLSVCENCTRMRMKMMTMAGKAPSGGAVASSGDRCSLSSPPQLTHPQHYSSLFAHRRPQFVSQKNPKTKRFTNPLTVAAKAGLPPPSLTSDDTTVSFVGEESVPLEGVIQFEKPNSFALINNRVALLAGGDVLALLIFSAFGRFSHGFSVFDTDTLRTADPFIAVRISFGGFGEDGRGMNGPSKAVIAAAKSWSLGIPGCIKLDDHLSNYTQTTVRPAAGAVFGKRLSDERLVVLPATMNLHSRIWAVSRAHVVQATLCYVSSVGISVNLCVSPELRRDCWRSRHVAGVIPELG